MPIILFLALLTLSITVSSKRTEAQQSGKVALNRTNAAGSGSLFP